MSSSAGEWTGATRSVTFSRQYLVAIRWRLGLRRPGLGPEAITPSLDALKHLRPSPGSGWWMLCGHGCE